jgi:hypothetical protein
MGNLEDIDLPKTADGVPAEHYRPGTTGTRS